MPLLQLPTLDWLNALHQLGLRDWDGQSPESICGDLLERTAQSFNATGGSLALYQGQTDKRLIIVAGIGLPPVCIGRVINEDAGIIGWVIKHNRPLRLTGNVRHDPRFQFSKAEERPAPPAVSLSWPLAVNRVVLGALCLHHASNEAGLSDQDLAAGELWAAFLSLVLDNLRLQAGERRHTPEFSAIHTLYDSASRQLQSAQSRLQQSDKRLHDALDSLDSVFWSIKSDTFAPFFLNQAAEEIYGYPVSRLLAEPDLWLDIIVPKDSARVKKCLNDLAATGVQKLTYRITHADGSQHWLFSHMHYISENEDGPARINGITVDITHYKNAQDLLKRRNCEIQTALDKLQEAQQQLVQSEKMASVGQLAAGVAHELNNPIGYINSNLTSLKAYINDLLTLLAVYETAENACSDPTALNEINNFKNAIDLDFVRSDILDLLTESLEGATRVKKIVQDLKDFSHLGGHEDWQWDNLHIGLESTLNILNNEIKYKYKAKVVKEFGNIPNIKCLPHQLNQVFMNLLVNAAHAIEQEGVITIRTGTDGANVWVEIGDTGKGIEPQYLNKIFDPFFTTKPVGKGTGLGLSVSYNIVKKHQGDIQLTSKINEGTVFKILLPIAGPDGGKKPKVSA